MKEKLRLFIQKYSQVMTVSMLLDLCDVMDLRLSELIDGNKLLTTATHDKKNSKEKSEVVEIGKVFLTEECLTCDEVAEKYKVKKITVWQWIREKKLPAVRVGREYRIRPQDIEEFENSRCTTRIV